VKGGTTHMVVIVLDALREDSVVPTFEDSDRCYKAATCITMAPWTLPSCTSLLTGVDPRRHRHFWHSGDLTTPGLVGALPANVRKVGLVNNTVLQPSSQLDAGFDKWAYTADHARPFEQAAALIRRARPRKPLFLLLHSNIAHDYYKRSAAAYFDQAFPDDAGGACTLGGRVIRWNGTTPAQRAAVARTYQASALKIVALTAEILALARERDDFVSVVVSDHGEGFDYEEGRVHHGGRLHDDLLRVPLYFDLPSTTSAPQRADLVAALASTPATTADVLPTVFALAGMGSVPDVDGRRLDTVTEERIVVSEERRYLYLKDRFRLNVKGRDTHMSDQDREENQHLQDQLARPPLVRSYRSKAAKLIMTSLVSRPSGGDPARSRPALMELGQRLLGSPVFALSGEHLLAFELYDLDDDPHESRNLLGGDGGGVAALARSRWAPLVTVPVAQADGAEADLLSVLDGAEHIASG
jgi:arylsulfatase A-like enzyme